MLLDDLRQYEIFVDLDDLEMRKLFQFSRYKFFKKGETIFTAGDEGSGFMLILKGELDYYLVDEEGHETLQDHFTTGEFIEMMSLFGDVQIRPYTAKASVDLSLLWINTLEYRRLQNSGPDTLTKLLLRLIIQTANTFRAKNGEFAATKKELEEIEKSLEPVKDGKASEG
ncbi:cyclic nucleotide-binding domain-containing protein [bacterium]|nr:cyclic nucleotide-binding domain-containing protein [bacterium]